MSRRNKKLDVPACNRLLDREIDSDEPLKPSINALWLPAMMLADDDPERCRRLLAQVLSHQREDGLLVDPAVEKRSSNGVSVAAWPLWTCVVDRVQRRFPDAAWLHDVLPKWRRAFLAAVNHFDPERHGLPCRRSAAEAWDARDFQANLATPDLATLLLMEVDTLQRLQSSSDPQLAEEREQLITGLLDFMANPETGRFDGRRVGGGRQPVSFRMAVFPLLWPGLPGAWIGRLLKHAEFGLVHDLLDTHGYSTSTEIWMWRRALIRVGAWELLKRIDAGCRRNLLARLDVQRPETADRDISGAAAQCLQADIDGRGPWTTRIIKRLRQQTTAPAMVAAVCLLLAAGWGMLGREPTVDAVTLALWHQEARTATAFGYPSASRAVETALEAAGVFEPFREMVLLQQAELRGDWPAAAAMYQRLRRQEGDKPLIIYGLARAKSRSAEQQAAREYWLMFIDRYSDTFPAAARAAREEWWRMERNIR